MLTKTLTGKEILQMVEKQLNREGLVVVSLTDDEIGLSNNGILTLEVSLKKGTDLCNR